MAERIAGRPRRTKSINGSSDDLTRAESYAATQKQLAERLVMLRAEFREAVANYSVHIQGLLTQLADTLVEQPLEMSAAERQARTRALREALAELDDIVLKPEKGRRRDLKKIENFVIRWCDTVADW